MIAIPCTAQGASVGDVAFFYGSEPPIRALHHYDHVVVSPDNIDNNQRKALSAGTTPVAYVSIGEADPSRDLPSDWVMGHNRGWNQDVMDLTQRGWRRRVLHRIDRLAAEGYQAFFLDTLDSYRRAVDDAEARAAQRSALEQLIQKIASRHPRSTLIINRGFQLLPEIDDQVSAVVAESLFAGWDPETQSYAKVSESERRWLLEQLREARERYNLPAIALDYVPASNRERAREVAQKIRELGIQPYVSVPSLDMLGVGNREIVPRRVLMLRGESTPTPDSRAFRLAAPVLEYMGLVPVYRGVDETLPKHRLTGRYAGVVIWAGRMSDEQRRSLERWIRKRVIDRVPLVMMGAAPIKAVRLMEDLGLQQAPSRAHGELSVTARRPLAQGFEGRPDAKRVQLPAWRSSSTDNRVLFGFEDADANRWHPVISGPWGGAALAPYVVEPLTDGRVRWLIDPFRFFQRSLDPPPAPIPDPTTENGRRILTTHIDGDGFVSRAQLPNQPFAAAVIHERILKRFDLPTTVSVIEGEIGPKGMHPERSDEAETLARAIFREDHVEAASHSYSHPFNWQASVAASDKSAEGKRGRYRLPIPDYDFRLARELDGSVRYIERQLLPQAKDVAVFLWTGNALPPPEALGRLDSLGVTNLNGGDTRPTRAHPSLTAVSPHVRPTDGGLQFFAPIANEASYTNNWQGPYGGYRRVIETFQITGAPRRLKPVGIYYHFYSGTKPASLKALRKVYQWASARPLMPIWGSEYAKRARGFHNATVSRDLDGDWHIRDLHGLRTVRLPDPIATPSLAGSVHVAGWRRSATGRYIHLSANKAVLSSNEGSTGRPRLVWSNAPLTHWEDGGARGIRFGFDGHQPIRFGVRAKADCRVRGASLTRRRRNQIQTFTAASAQAVDGTLLCR